MNIKLILGKILAGAMGVIGAITLGVFVVGGFMWLTSAGNDEQIKKGTQSMLWAVIGLFIIFSSYAILNLILDALGSTAEGGNTGIQLTPLTNETADKEAKTQVGCYCARVVTYGEPASKEYFPELSVNGKEECEGSHADLKVDVCEWRGEKK